MARRSRQGRSIIVYGIVRDRITPVNRVRRASWWCGRREDAPIPLASAMGRVKTCGRRRPNTAPDRAASAGPPGHTRATAATSSRPLRDRARVGTRRRRRWRAGRAPGYQRPLSCPSLERVSHSRQEAGGTRVLHSDGASRFVQTGHSGTVSYYKAGWKPFERRPRVNDPRNNAPLGGGPGNRPPRPQFSGRAWLVMLVVVILFDLIFYSGFFASRSTRQSARITIPYSTFVTQVNANNVKTAKISSTMASGDFRK